MGDVVPLHPRIKVWRFVCLACGTKMTFSRTEGVAPPMVGHCGNTLEPLPGAHIDGSGSDRNG